MANQKTLKANTPPPSLAIKKRKNSIVFLLIGFIGGVMLTALYFLYATGANTHLKHNFSTQIENVDEISGAITPLSKAQLEEMKQELEKHLRHHKLLGRITDASVVFEALNTHLKFTINPEFVFSPSSLMKVPVMMTCLKKASNTPLFLKEQLPYERSMDLIVKGPEAVESVKTSMEIGREYSVEKLLELMICKSDNEATYMLIQRIGLEKIHELELKVGFSMPKISKYYESYTTTDKYMLFFTALNEKKIIGEEMSAYALELLARADWNYGIRKAVPANIRVHHKYGVNSYPYSPTEERVNQVHNFAIVDLPGNPFILGIATQGDDELSMYLYLESVASLLFRKLTSNIKYYKVQKQPVV